jgi:thiol-disulfide isomerase/thioredoxin
MKAMEYIIEFLSSHPELRSNIGLYDPSKETMDTIKQNIEGMEIKVFTAEWCPDCRINVPKFFSILMALEDSDFSLEIIEVKRGMTDENNLAEKMNVMAIPTFIFLKDGKELGRIIEHPKGKLEEDMAEILVGSNRQ